MPGLDPGTSCQWRHLAPQAREPRPDAPWSTTRRTLLTLPLLTATTKAQAQPCQRLRIAQLPLRLVEGYPIVPATIAGQPVSLILDTGAQGMLVTPEAATRLALPLAGLRRIEGTGGAQQARIVRLPDLRLGGAQMPEQLAPILPLPVTLTTNPPLAGLLGALVLSQFDLELDVPAGRITLYAPSACPPPPGITLPLETTREGEAFIPVRVNGQTLLALLDTGTRATILTQSAARRLGLGAPTSANTAAGVDGKALPLEHVRVRLSLGNEPPEDTGVSIAPLQLDRADMLLGLDQLGRRPLWISYTSGVAVFTPR